MNLDKLNIYSVLGLRQCHSLRPLLRPFGFKPSCAKPMENDLSDEAPRVQ